MSSKVETYQTMTTNIFFKEYMRVKTTVIVKQNIKKVEEIATLATNTE